MNNAGNNDANVEKDSMTNVEKDSNNDANVEKDSNDNDNLNEEVSNMNIDNHSSTRICLHCLKKVEGSSRCSQCMTALYCSRDCQLKHWPVHKNICEDSNVENSNQKLKMKAKNYSNQGNFQSAEKQWCSLQYIYIYMTYSLPERIRDSLKE